MTSKILVLVNGPAYVAEVQIATHGEGPEPVVQTINVRGGSEAQAAREFYISTGQTVTVTEFYDPPVAGEAPSEDDAAVEATADFDDGPTAA